MTRSESAPIAIARRDSTPRGADAEYTVVWVGGEHDIATEVSLVVAIARAAQRDDADLLVDLSEVTFMDASTIGALVGSRNRLRNHSQSLQLRAPSQPALRVLQMCELAHLIYSRPAGAGHPTGTAAALSTWVDVTPTTSSPIMVETARSEERDPAVLPRAHSRLASVTATIEVDRGGS